MSVVNSSIHSGQLAINWFISGITGQIFSISLKKDDLTSNLKSSSVCVSIYVFMYLSICSAYIFEISAQAPKGRRKPSKVKLKMTFVVCPILSDLSHFPVEFQLAQYEMEVLLCMFWIFNHHLCNLLRNFVLVSEGHSFVSFFPTLI